MNLDSVWHNNNFIISVAAAKIYNEKYFSIHMPPRYLADEHIQSAKILVLITKDSTRGEIYHAITLINSFYSTRMGADDCWFLHKNHSKIWTAIHATDVADVSVVQSVIDAQRSVWGTDNYKVLVGFWSSVVCTFTPRDVVQTIC